MFFSCSNLSFAAKYVAHWVAPLARVSFQVTASTCGTRNSISSNSLRGCPFSFSARQDLTLVVSVCYSFHLFLYDPSAKLIFQSRICHKWRGSGQYNTSEWHIFKIFVFSVDFHWVQYMADSGFNRFYQAQTGFAVLICLPDVLIGTHCAKSNIGFWKEERLLFDKKEKQISNQNN